MAALLIRYARCSTDQQDLTAQHDGLIALGVAANRIYVDYGLTGTNRERPGLREALAACREGDTLVVTKLDRLARSLPDARAIADELSSGQVRLNLGGSVTTPPIRSAGCSSITTAVFTAGDKLKVTEEQRQQAIALQQPAREEAVVGRIGAFSRTDFREDLPKVDVPALPRRAPSLQCFP